MDLTTYDENKEVFFSRGVNSIIKNLTSNMLHINGIYVSYQIFGRPGRFNINLILTFRKNLPFKHCLPWLYSSPTGELLPETGSMHKT